MKINDLYHHNKGKMQVIVVNSNKDSSKMLEFIKIVFNLKVRTFKFTDLTYTHKKYIVLNELDAEIYSSDLLPRKAEKKSIYEYKILPNTE